MQLHIWFFLVSLSSYAQVNLKGMWIEEATYDRGGEYFEFKENLEFTHVLMIQDDLISNGTYRLEEDILILEYEEQEPKISKSMVGNKSDYLYFNVTYKCEPLSMVTIRVPDTEFGVVTSLDGVARLSINSLNKYESLLVTGYGMKPIEIKISEFRNVGSVQIDMVPSINSNYNWNKVIKISNQKLILRRGKRKKFKRILTPATQEQIDRLKILTVDDC